MAKIIEITESKVDKMSNLVEDMLLAGGELMHCLTKLSDEMYGERGGNNMSGGNYGNRSRYGERGNYGNRVRDEYDDDDDWREMREMIGERRNRRNYRR